MHSRIRQTLYAAGLALTALPLLAMGARADEAADRAARWKDLSQSIFGTKALVSDDQVKIEAPVRALEAAIVPVTLSVAPEAKVKSLYFVIDENPSPLAAKFNFGPAADPHKISMRVRVDAYTNLHAVAETEDGKLHQSERFLKASGGCSAPVGMSEQEAMQGMGFMRFKKRGEAMAGRPLPVTLMVWHPNFNGMQMNDVTRMYTPARFIKTIDVTYNDKLVFHMDGDISISSNPVLDFSLIPEDAKGEVKVVAVDSQKGRWEQKFEVPLQTTN